MAYISVRPPTRPININIIKIILDAIVREGVIPKDRPTVPMAEDVSKRQVKKGRSSMALKAKAPLKDRNRYKKNIAPAAFTASSITLLPKHSASPFLLKTAKAERIRTAIVVVFIPPAVDPGDPPISIRKTLMACPDWDREE